MNSDASLHIGRDAFMSADVFRPHPFQPPKRQAPASVMNARIPFEGWHKPIAKRLMELGIIRWRDLAPWTWTRLLIQDGLGQKSVRYILRKVCEAGVSHDPTLPFPPKTPAVIPDSPGVYFIRCEGFIKVGSTGNIRMRLVGLGLANPYELDLLTFIRTDSRAEAYRLEGELHQRFEKHWYRGEWFRDHQEIRWFIERAMAA